MSNIFLSEQRTAAAITGIAVKNCGRYLRTIQVDDGPHAWMSGSTLFVCPGHGDNRYQKEPSGHGYLGELRGKEDA